MKRSLALAFLLGLVSVQGIQKRDSNFWEPEKKTGEITVDDFGNKWNHDADSDDYVYTDENNVEWTYDSSRKLWSGHDPENNKWKIFDDTIE